jgi:hypothetical protein
MANSVTKQGEGATEGNSNVVPLFADNHHGNAVPPLSDEEILRLRTFMREFAIIRATCPMALRALSDR